MPRNNKYAVIVKHSIDDIDNVCIEYIPYVGGLQWMYNVLGCELVQMLTLEYYIPDFPVDEFPFVDLYIDDEGKLNGAPPTFPLYDIDGRLSDVIYGSLLFINGNDHTGDSYGLEKEEAILLVSYLFFQFATKTRFHVSSNVDFLHMI